MAMKLCGICESNSVGEIPNYNNNFDFLSTQVMQY